MKKARRTTYPPNRRPRASSSGLPAAPKAPVKPLSPFLLDLVAPDLAVALMRADLRKLRKSLEAPPAPAPPPAEGLISMEEAARRANLSRDTLDRMVKRAPSGLPGAPVSAGVGQKRHHWRWDPNRFAEWLTAYRTWDAEQRARRGRASSPRPRRTGPTRSDGKTLLSRVNAARRPVGE